MQKVKLTIAVIASAVFLSVIVGCAAKQPEPPTPQEVFAKQVSQADTAFNDGDAEKAFELYTSALKVEGAEDQNGTVAGKQEEAKKLMLARRLLASTDPGPSGIDAYVQVLGYASAESTEAAAARAGLSECFRQFVTPAITDIAAMRRDIKADKGVGVPLSTDLIARMSAQWSSQTATVPQPPKESIDAALSQMKKGAALVQKAYDSKYAEDALAALADADKAMLAADAALKQAAK